MHIEIEELNCQTQKDILSRGVKINNIRSIKCIFHPYYSEKNLQIVFEK